MELFNRMGGSHRAGPWPSPDQASWTTDQASWTILALGPGSDDEPAPAVRAARATLTTPPSGCRRRRQEPPAFHRVGPKARRAALADRDYDCGQRWRLSCPTRRSSSAVRWRRTAFSACSWARVAAVSWSRRARQRMMRHRGEQTRCGLRPVRGRPQTAQRPASGGVRTSPGARSGMGPYATHPGRTRRLEGEREGCESTGSALCGNCARTAAVAGQVGRRPSLPVP